MYDSGQIVGPVIIIMYFTVNTGKYIQESEEHD